MIYNSYKKHLYNFKKFFNSKGFFHPILWAKIFILIIILWIIWKSYSPGMPVEDYAKEVFANTKTFVQEVIEDLEKFEKK